MVFIKKFFIFMFIGLFSFIAFQITFRKLLGLEMIYFKDILNYFSTISVTKFDFGRSIANFTNDPSFNGFLQLFVSLGKDALVIVEFIWSFFSFLFT